MTPEQRKAQWQRRRRAGRCVDCGAPELGPGAIRCQTCKFDQLRGFCRRAQREELPPGKKRCTKCKDLKDADLVHFYRHPASHDGLQSRCIECHRSNRERYRDRPSKAPRGRHCSLCEGMPWRVTGATCRRCGLEHAPEPEPSIAAMAGAT